MNRFLSWNCLRVCWKGTSQYWDLNIRWEHGGLGWYDPANGLHIPTFDSERERADGERERANNAEARVRELEAEIRRLSNS